MATINPGRLHDVTNVADHITLVADNFEILSEELFKRKRQGECILFNRRRAVKMED